MKAPLRSPILPGPERALFPLKLLSKALRTEPSMVLICSFFYNVIKTAANSKQRRRAPGSTLGRVGSPVAAEALSVGTAAPMGAACPRVPWRCHRPCSAPMGLAESGPSGARLGAPISSLVPAPSRSCCCGGAGME